MPTNIKVDRLLLIKSLEEEQKKQTDQFKREMEKFRQAEKELPDRIATVLEKMAKDARRGKKFSTTSTYRNGKYVTTIQLDDSDLPAVPSKPNNTSACELQKQIRTLKMSKQETIIVNSSSEYVQFACSLNGDS